MPGLVSTWMGDCLGIRGAVFRSFLVAQMVKSLPAKWETQVQSLGREDPLEKEITTHSSMLAWKNTTDGGAWRATIHGVTKSQTQLKQCTHCSPTSSLSIGFPRQGYWSELPFPSPVDLLDQGWNPCLLHWQADPSPLGHQGSEPSPEYDDIFYPTVY